MHFNRLFLYIALSAMTGDATAAEVEIVPDFWGSNNRIVEIKGPIVQGDLFKVQNKSAELLLSGDTTQLCFSIDTLGGDANEAMAIGRFARQLLVKITVHGSQVFDPDADETKKNLGDQIVEPMKPYVFLKQSVPVEPNIVSCYSAGVLIFYGGAFRIAQDNIDYRESYFDSSGAEPGLAGLKVIPVIGLHRPYLDPSAFARLSSDQAQETYRDLVDKVRDYLHEMGAPATVADRMLRTASDEIDLVPAEEFARLYHVQEPFVEEWLLAKCGNLEGILSEAEVVEYNNIHQESWHQAQEVLLSGRRLSDLSGEEMAQFFKDVEKFVPRGRSAAAVEELRDRVLTYRSRVQECRNRAILGNQLNWAVEFVSKSLED